MISYWLSDDALDCLLMLEIPPTAERVTEIRSGSYCQESVSFEAAIQNGFRGSTRKCRNSVTADSGECEGGPVEGVGRFVLFAASLNLRLLSALQSC